MVTPKRKPDLTTLFWFILWPWRSQYFLVDGSCDEMARKLADVIADGTRWRGRIEGNEFCVWRVGPLRWPVVVRRGKPWGWVKFVGSWYPSGHSCVLRLARRPSILEMPLVVGQALFALFALVLALLCGLARRWEGVLWFLTIGVLVIPISRIEFTCRYVWPALFELLWYMGGTP